jgi:S1-C subfamily serine protease
MKMNPVEYVIAVLLAPLGLGIGMVWAVQKFPKARMMLLISAPMTVLFGAGVLAYIVYNPGNVGGPVPTADVTESPFSGEGGGSPWDPPGNPPGGRDEPAIVGPPKEEDLKNQPEPIQRAMRANVRLIVSNRMLGSGIVVEMKNNVVMILTNRHVIDEVFANSKGAQETPLDSMPTVNVTYVTGAQEPGKVVWVAPNRIDLAVVRAFCQESGVVAAKGSGTAVVGEPVFAVGNPVGLGWTLTRGTVSALRPHEAGTTTIPVIQTDAAITHGNSGGGLYNGKGELIGINNFIINPRLASNTGFAIRFSLIKTMDDVPFSLSGQ